ncbi:MbtH family protein [Amycolatopsis aidingensis]|uniref:MbtH family protein n=1 Tax=Amycolatopsis aidingensis TaxID=2842453 RepID=UPI001C0D1D9B|nr:MbtH family NRPS accessory protein [Amycolatopsis aidingensis]
MSGENEETEYEVVVNQEEQYSIWPVARPVPDGWRTVGQRGRKQHCLDWIEQHWTDMRPRSLRETLSAAAARERV